MTPKLVIFDCDGVLVDSEPISNQMLIDDFALYGLTFSRDDITRLFLGGTMARVEAQVRAMGADLPPDWLPDFSSRMIARLAQGTPLIPGIADVLSGLRARGIALHVASNGPPAKMVATLGQHPAVYALLKDHIYSSHRDGAPKPAPEMLLKAVAAHGVTLADCVFVDDSPSGCLAGMNAGIRTLGFAPHDDGHQLRAIGAEVFHDMLHLPTLLHH